MLLPIRGRNRESEIVAIELNICALARVTF